MSFYPANLHAGMTPDIMEKRVKAAEVWPKGSLVLMNASGEWEECGADPAVIGGVALSGYGQSLAYGELRTDGFPPGFCQAALARGAQLFLAKYVGSLGTPGTNYGVVVDSDGLWKLDFNETVNARVTYQRALATDNLGLPSNLVFCTFIPSVAQVL